MRNIGPKSMAMLYEIGITSHEQLVDRGAVAVFQMLKSANPRVSLNMLWALEGAIQDEPWQHIAHVHKKRLLTELGELK